MAIKDHAFIKLGDSGQAPVLNYNVPDRTSYAGANVIDLEIDEDLFNAEAKQAPVRAAAPPPGGRIERHGAQRAGQRLLFRVRVPPREDPHQ